MSLSLLGILARESPLTSSALMLVCPQKKMFLPISRCILIYLFIYLRPRMAELQRLLVNGPPMKKNITTYFHTNIYETTAGNFATELLKFHINQIGLDRIMYSIDYPFVSLMFFPPSFFRRTLSLIPLSPFFFRIEGGDIRRSCLD